MFLLFLNYDLHFCHAYQKIRLSLILTRWPVCPISTCKKKHTCPQTATPKVIKYKSCGELSLLIQCKTCTFGLE